MPARLVYSPKVYAFTKNSAGEVINITDYITAGRCQRLVNQASTAEVTLRNPNRIFTMPKNPTFHPMDGITIFLERIKGYPIQVFTGYLDETPYFQMYPGTVTITATCTLKRLIYTYFDPSLPYVNAFFASYGWVNNQDGSLVQLPAMANQGQVVNGNDASTNTTLQDGSIGKLLYATLTDIGEWDDTNIYIEELPSGADGLASRIADLMTSVNASNQDIKQELTQFLDGSLGSGSQGQGGSNLTSGGSITTSMGLTVKGAPITEEQATDLTTALSVAARKHANSLATVSMIFAGIAESTWNRHAVNTGHKGIWQSTAFNGDQVAAAAAAWLTGGPSFGAGGGIRASKKLSSPIAIAEAVEVGGAYAGDTAKWLKEAQAIVAAFQNSSAATTTGTVRTTSTTNPTSSSVRGVGTPGGTVTEVASGSGGSSGGNTTVINAVVSACATISNAKLPYVWGGGHSSAGTPSGGTSGQANVGFDCSGAVAAALSAGGLVSPGSAVGADNDLISLLKANGVIAPGPGSGAQYITLFDYPGQHIYMRVNGKNWGTYGGGGSGLPSNSPGGGWLPDGPPPSSVGGAGVVEYHVLPSLLSQNATFQLNLGGAGSTGTSGSGGTMLSQASAEAFTAAIAFPSIQDMTTAILLGQQGKGLMHDQQLLPFVQQLTQASMRSFQSLPNGDFYAFYPDYFGEFNHHPAYWQIPDIEIMTGDIYLNDLSLVTHQFTVGDNSYPLSNQLFNELFSSGVITIYNAFTPGLGILEESDGLSNAVAQNEATAFIQRYGARPQVSNYPQVRSGLFEMYLAYQQFMLSWSNQFASTFSFTFMPEVYPGGKVAFPSHGIQMYIQSVTHTWDYTEGFSTDAVLTAPSQYGSNPDIPPYMVRALVDAISKSVTNNAQTEVQKMERSKLAS